jgi:hypothetical protein
VLTYINDVESAAAKAGYGNSETDRLIERESGFGTHIHMAKQGINKQLNSGRFHVTGKLSSGAKAVIVASVLVILYPLIIAACMIMPTWWNLFTWSGINYYQALIPSTVYGWYLSVSVGNGTVVGKLFPVSG